MSLTIYIPAHLSRELWMMDRNKSITQLYKSIQKKLGCGPLNITLSAHWEKITPEFHQHLDLGAIKEDSGLYSILELSISQVGKAVSQDRHYARKKNIILGSYQVPPSILWYAQYSACHCFLDQLKLSNVLHSQLHCNYSVGKRLRYDYEQYLWI